VEQILTTAMTAKQKMKKNIRDNFILEPYRNGGKKCSEVLSAKQQGI
jgi:hypothetical protein